MALTQVDQGLLGTYAQYTGFKNRLINSAMVIDQRNAGASITPTNGQYCVDRWQNAVNVSSKYSCQQVADAPAGFTYSLKATSLSAYTIGTGEIAGFRQYIEGYNIADLGQGTSNATSFTLSFWVKSSLTGTFGGVVSNDNNRTWAFTYTISSASTWEQKTITITGQTGGTWLTTNGIGLSIIFSLACGSTYLTTPAQWNSNNSYGATGQGSVLATNGATWQITGVQLEKGSTATSFDYRPYGTELSLCQRYLPAWNWVSGNDNVGFGYSASTTSTFINITVPVTPRVAPTGISTSAMTNFVLRNGSNVGGTPTAIAMNVSSSGLNQSIAVTTTAGSPTISAGQGAFLFASGAAQILLTGCEL